MKHVRRSSRRRGVKLTAWFAASAVTLGLMTFGAVTSASADDLVEGGVYGWGREGSGVAATPFELQFPNDAGPFVDVAITGSSGSEQTTLAVTEDGDVVTQGNHRNIVSNMPATIAAADVIAIDVAGFAEGNALGAAVVTRDGRVITWNTMPAMTQACVTAAAAAGGVQDVQVVLSGSQFRGVALLKDGSLCSWANFSSFVSAQPKGKNFVKVAVDRDHSIALTSDGKVQAWSHTAGSRVVSNIGALEGHTIVDIAVSESIGAAVTDTGEVIVWGGDSEGNVKPTDQFPADQARGKVVALADQDTGRTGMLAITDRGELIPWGWDDFGDDKVMTSVPPGLEGHEVLAAATTRDSHIAIIVGKKLEIDEDPLTVSSQPSLDGDATVGETLTATPATFSESDGVTVTHQWYATAAGGEPVRIPGADGTTLALTADHLDRTITYTTTAQRGSETAVVSDPSNGVGPVTAAELPDLTVESGPTIALEDGADTPNVGVTIEATPATFSDDSQGVTIEHQWFRDDVRIDGVDTVTYTLSADDLGADITYRSRAVRAADDASATSDFSGAIGPVVPVVLAFTSPPVVNGNGYIGVEQTVIDGATTDDANVTSTYEWTVTFDDDRPDVTATGPTFTPTEDHRGGTITLTQTATRGDDVVTETSGPVGPVRDQPEPITIVTEASIAGTAFVGETAVGTPATFDDPEAQVQNYWVYLSTGEEVPATVDEDGKARLLLTVEDHNKEYIVFRSKATRPGEETVTSTSPFTAILGPVYLKLAVESVPVIAGTAKVGQDLTVGEDAVFNDDDFSVAVLYRWYADGVEVHLGRSLRLTDDLLGKQITLEARAERGTDVVNATSAAVGPVQEALPPVAIVTEASIAGTPFVGETAVGTPATFNDPEVQVQNYWVYLSTGEEVPATVDEDGKARLLLTVEDHNKEYIVFRSKATRPGEETVTSTSPFTAILGPVYLKLAVESVPVIAGTAKVGQDLTVGEDAVFNDDDFSVAVLYRWYADGVEVKLGRSLSLTDDLVGKQITLEARAERGTDVVNASSAPVGPVRLATDVEVVDQPTLAGAPIIGQTLTATPATFDQTDGVTIENRWSADGVRVDGVTGTTFTLREEDAGKTISYQTVATRAADQAVFESDSVTAGPVLVVLAATSNPTITGEPQVGKTIVGTPATFTTTAGVTVTNQWFVDGQPIEGATNAILELTAEHEGAQITFSSTATRGEEEPVVVVSTPVGPVEPEDEEPGSPTGEVIIDLDGPTAPGATITVQVGTAFAGQEVQVYLSNLDRLLAPATVAADGTIQVLVPGDIPLGTHRLAVYSGGSLVGWDDFAVTLVRPEDPAFKDLISVSPNPVKAGDQVTIQVGADRVGQRVRVVLFSSPRDLGFVTVAADGTVKVTIPADMTSGIHRVAIYDEAGALIGWQDITVAGDGANGSGGRNGILPGTGAGDVGPMIPLGLTFLLAGLGLLAYRARGRHLLS